MQRQIAMEGGGTLTVSDEGIRVRLTVSRHDDHSGLYKVWLRGMQGKMLLGTLVPERGMLALARTMPKAALEREGCWPLTGGEAVMAYSFQNMDPFSEPGWEQMEHPDRLFHDPVLEQAARGLSHVLVRQEEDCFSLAVPFSTDQEFPLIPLFCLARVIQIGRRSCIMWKFEKNGIPRYKRENQGDTSNGNPTKRP